MDPTKLSIVIYVAVGLIVATVLLVLRDIFQRLKSTKDQVEKEKPLDIASLLPPPNSLASEPKQMSWFAKLVADTHSDFTPDTALMLAAIIGLALGGLLYLWREDWLAAATGAVIGLLTVGAILFRLRSVRHRKIRDQLPDIMELMARAVRAGRSLDQAIALAGETPHKPLGTEFQHCYSQLKMGLSLDTVMRRLIDRAPLAEIRILAMALTVQHKHGGSLPNTLERLAAVFRDRGNFYRQFRAATALSRASITLIVLICLGLDFFVILGRSEYAENLVTTNVGRAIVAIALALQVLGIAWVLWLFRSDY